MADAYLLDTNMVGRFADARPDAEVDQPTRNFRQHLAKLTDPLVAVCVITVGEVEWGLRRQSRLLQERKQEIRRVLQSFEVIYDVTPHTAVPCYADARVRLFTKFAPKDRRTGMARTVHIDTLVETGGALSLGIEENDLWIASVAMQYNLVLITDDRMERLREVCQGDLRVENWLRP